MKTIREVENCPVVKLWEKKREKNRITFFVNYLTAAWCFATNIPAMNSYVWLGSFTTRVTRSSLLFWIYYSRRRWSLLERKRRPVLNENNLLCRWNGNASAGTLENFAEYVRRCILFSCMFSTSFFVPFFSFFFFFLLYRANFLYKFFSKTDALLSASRDCDGVVATRLKVRRSNDSWHFQATASCDRACLIISLRVIYASRSRSLLNKTLRFGSDQAQRARGEDFDGRGNAIVQVWRAIHFRRAR